MAGNIMNRQRRKELARIYNVLQDCVSDLEFVRDEEQEAFDNLPESLQYSEKGELMEECVDNIESVITDLENVCSDLEEIFGNQ
jgi:hypothetical protein